VSVPVFSTRFGLEHSFDGIYSYEVPAGYVAVVKEIDVTYGISVGASVVAYGPGDAAFWSYHFGTIDLRRTESYQGRAVFYAGEIFSVELSDTGDLYIGGYLLTLP
jgi:hypothetical protein